MDLGKGFSGIIDDAGFLHEIVYGQRGEEFCGSVRRQDDSGTHLAVPAKYPYLRCTRVLQPRMVLTIEPGIYFIESLLAPWREGQFSKHFNWQKIEALKPFGGIRIEDNVVIHENSIENMTRDLKLA